MSERSLLLVHGINDTGAVFDWLADELRDRGWVPFCPNLRPNDGSAPLETLVEQVAAFVEAELPPGPFDLVGFSMGGLVARSYWQQESRVRRFVSISAPNNGTWLAYFSAKPGIAQMRPNSAFLQDLAIPDRATILWTPFDAMILPPSSSRLPGVADWQIPALLHPWMLRDRRCVEAIVAALSRP